MTYIDQVKTHWNLYSRKVRAYESKGTFVLAIYWNKRVAFMLPHRFPNKDRALAFAAKVEQKDLFNTHKWVRFENPLNYRVFKKPWYINI